MLSGGRAAAMVEEAVVHVAGGFGLRHPGLALVTGGRALAGGCSAYPDEDTRFTVYATISLEWMPPSWMTL